MNSKATIALRKLIGDDHIDRFVEMDRSMGTNLGGLTSRGDSPSLRPSPPPNPPIQSDLWTCNNCGAKSQFADVCAYCGGHEKLV